MCSTRSQQDHSLSEGIIIHTLFYNLVAFPTVISLLTLSLAKEIQDSKSVHIEIASPKRSE